jgi:kynureninase
MVTDSTSVNLFKVVSAALALRPDRQVILTETRNFPTDNYIAEGVIRQCGDRHRLVHVNDAAELTDALDESVAVLMLTHVSYRTGAMHDMKALTKAAHNVGALVIWDLAHSAGALPVDLAGCDADFAVGCGYKYLNGGPGAPSFVYVAPQHLGGFRQPLTGWFAHKDPFAFAPHYEPATDITQFLCGTSPVLSLVALDAALDVWADVDMDALRSKSSTLCDYFIHLVEARCGGHGLTLVTPRDAAVRGSQVSFTHETGGYAMISALIADGVIGDFRAPDILRFGFTPLYTRFVDVWDAVDRLATILAERRWDTPAFHTRKTVT